MPELFIKNGTLITSEDTDRTNIIVENGLISSLTDEELPPSKKMKTIDATGKLIFSGGVDPHVHLHLDTPAGPSCDDFESGSRAALAGGTTYFIDFVTPIRGESLQSAFKKRFNESTNSLTDYHFHMGISEWTSHTADEMAWCVQEAGIRSFKTYLAYKSTIGIEPEELKKVMQTAALFGATVLVHCEDGTKIVRLQRQMLKQGNTAPRYHALSRPVETETAAVKQVIALCRETGCTTYLVHVSSAGSVELIARAKREGLPLFAETCPHYLLLDDSCYQKPDAEALAYVFSPPLRSKADQAALWDALQSGVIDTVATDHCPFNLHGQKDVGKDDFTRIPNGTGGIEFRLQLLYTYGVLGKRISMNRFVELVSDNPARIFRISQHKGDIRPGMDADLVIWNPDKEMVISAKTQYQHCDHTIYEGIPVKGFAEMVLLKGVVYHR